MTKEDFLNKVNGSPCELREIAYEAIKTDDPVLQSYANEYLNSLDGFWSYLEEIGYEAG